MIIDNSAWLIPVYLKRDRVLIYEHGKASLICFHGITDGFVECSDKKDFVENIGNFIFNDISPAKIDGNIFKSTNHGLGANFIQLFHHVCEQDYWSFGRKEIKLENLTFTTDCRKYEFVYDGGFPLVKVTHI